MTHQYTLLSSQLLHFTPLYSSIHPTYFFISHVRLNLSLWHPATLISRDARSHLSLTFPTILQYTPPLYFPYYPYPVYIQVNWNQRVTRHGDLHHCQQSNRVSNDQLIWRKNCARIWVVVNTIQYNTTQYNTTQCNTIQYNTIQFNTIQYNTISLSVRQCLSLSSYFIITRPNLNAVESMDASTWSVDPKPRIIMRSDIYDVLVYYYQSLLLFKVWSGVNQIDLAIPHDRHR